MFVFANALSFRLNASEFAGTKGVQTVYSLLIQTVYIAKLCRVYRLFVEAEL